MAKPLNRASATSGLDHCNGIPPASPPKPQMISNMSSNLQLEFWPTLKPDKHISRHSSSFTCPQASPASPADSCSPPNVFILLLPIMCQIGSNYTPQPALHPSPVSEHLEAEPSACWTYGSFACSSIVFCHWCVHQLKSPWINPAVRSFHGPQPEKPCWSATLAPTLTPALDPTDTTEPGLHRYAEAKRFTTDNSEQSDGQLLLSSTPACAYRCDEAPGWS